MPGANTGMAGFSRPYAQNLNLTSRASGNSGSRMPLLNAPAYDNLTPKGKPKDYKEGGQAVKFDAFHVTHDKLKALLFLQQFDAAFAGGNFTESSKIRKVVHDGHDVFFLLTFPGPFEFTQGDKHKCPSVALMFGIGDDATYNDMGGCKQNPDACSSDSCEGHAVDLMHFSIGGAIPGRLYGANAYDNANSTGKDSIGSLHDMYGWNPHCRYFDGLLPNESSIPNSGSQNDWRGAWSHSSMDLTYGLTSSDSPYSAFGAQGTFTFEFARPLRTSDRFQQDVQFTIGNTHRFMAALWFPVNHVPWVNYQHYTASCDWIPLDVQPFTKPMQKSSINIISAVTLLFSLGALVASATVCWWTRTKRLLPFQAIEML
ncbi:hypothetical protein L7F22_005436 [Adiantum nelumboides]|nr:hypothetical protein [Adiantum nelumboides]